jgi:hypothetical protein
MENNDIMTAIKGKLFFLQKLFFPPKFPDPKEKAQQVSPSITTDFSLHNAFKAKKSLCVLLS